MCRCNQLPVDEMPVPLHKNQQRTPEYLAINPLGKVPALQVPASQWNLGSPRCPRSAGARLSLKARADWKALTAALTGRRWLLPARELRNPALPGREIQRARPLVSR